MWHALLAGQLEMWDNWPALARENSYFTSPRRWMASHQTIGITTWPQHLSVTRGKHLSVLFILQGLLSLSPTSLTLKQNNKLLLFSGLFLFPDFVCAIPSPKENRILPDTQEFYLISCALHFFPSLMHH